MERINMHKSKYKDIHIGLIQVAIKPLIRVALNIFALAYVRDSIGWIRWSINHSYPQINRISTSKTHTTKTRNYYRGSSPMNIQFKEIPDIANCKYDGSSLVEWNIDGLTEYGILNILRIMIIFTNAWMLYGNSQAEMITPITIGFTSQLHV